MAKLLKWLMVMTFSLLSLNLHSESYIQVPEYLKLPDGRLLVTVFQSDFKEEPTFGTNWEFPHHAITLTCPQIKLKYNIPSIRGNNSQLYALLKKKPNAKIVVRASEQCKNADFIDMIETKLSRLGFTIMDRNSTDGLKDMKKIADTSGADLLLDVSWLKFSDEEMRGVIDENSLKISDCGIYTFETGYLYCFDNIDNYKNVAKKIKKGKKVDCSKYKLKNVFNDYVYNQHLISNTIFDKDSYVRDIKEHLLNDETLGTNHNVISAIFKFYDLKDGAMVGYFQEGVSDIDEITVPAKNIACTFMYMYFNITNVSQGKDFYCCAPIGSEHQESIASYKVLWHAPWHTRYYEQCKNNYFLATTLTYYSCCLNTDDIPYANRLNDFLEIKLTDETITENSSTSSNTRSSYGGAGYTNYHRHFSNSRWRGGGSSNTTSNTSTTTTFKDAEWLRPSDFYGYYKPLADKLVKSISEEMQR